MKKLLIILSLLSSHAMATDYSHEAKDYIGSTGKQCQEVSHIQELNYGNITAYDITCINTDSTIIYQYVQQQLVTTHYINN